jgi:dipeptidyl aminopeptidase/acylaminoacyl peptidase
MGNRRVRSRAIAAAATACLASAAWAGSPPLSEPGPIDPLIESMIQPSMYWGMAIAPDGKRAAGLAWNGAMSVVVVLDLATHKRRIVTNDKLALFNIRKEDEQPTQIWWVNDDMIAVNFRDKPAQVFDLEGKSLMELDRRVVFQGYENGKLSDWVLVARDHRSLDSLVRVNVRTGERRKVRVDAPGDIIDWTADDRGMIRMVETISSVGWTPNSRLTHWYRADESSPWQKLYEHGLDEADWVPVVVPLDGGPVLILAHNGGDRQALWRYDPIKRAFGDVVARDAVDDVVGLRNQYDTTQLRSVTTGGLISKTTWLDPEVAALQELVDDALPGRHNTVKPNTSGDALIYSAADRDPGRWYAYDATKKQLQLIGIFRPAVDTQRMSPMQTLRYPSTDGFQVPAYLTLPGSADSPAHPLPLVVLVHGGEKARTYWGWDREVQSLAAHGYAVLQPQYRGSSGFGLRFETSSLGQWGLGMEDDIAAGVREMVARGIADPARVCIMGEGFGGYAAMWGLARDPALYKCGISIDGIHDIPRMMADISSPPIREWMRTHIGDREQVSDAFPAVSPIKHAGSIAAPVLLIHWAGTGTLLQNQAWAMQAALQEHHADVQLLQIPYTFNDGENYEATRRFYAAIFALLERTIGKGKPPFPAAAAQAIAPATPEGH